MSFSRLMLEVKILQRLLKPNDFRAAIGALVATAPSIVSRKNLTAFDERMSRDLEICYNGKSVVIPAATIDRQLAGTGDNASFGVVREMFGSDVYLRGIKPLRDVTVVLDLGSNRGFFSLLAYKLWGPKTIVAVEPTKHYNASFAIIVSSNSIPADAVQRVNLFIGATNDEKTITIGKLMDDHGIGRADFVKCDIEGSEYAAFSGNPETVKRIANLAMELHPWCGHNSTLVRFLTSTGMTVMTTDQNGHIVEPDRALYLYASREGQIKPVYFAEGVTARSPFSVGTPMRS
ncbi:FkbM family methyltransferase [Rhodovulum sp. PH10]|uniref:FkbM family methyltransferase n=1 Tax=Rhodovulum sp. PH10 TaxID=1187851 RepID=UPI00058B119D|nr:FkbM family methyltransferase [Rhodovulum sp. PH10]